MLIDLRSLNDIPIVQYALTVYKPLILYSGARASVFARVCVYLCTVHDEVSVIGNPFRRNFDTVADSPSCLLDADVCLPAKLRARGFVTRPDRSNEILIHRFGEREIVVTRAKRLTR